MTRLEGLGASVILFCFLFPPPAPAQAAPTQDLVRFRLETTDLFATPVSSVQLGDDFLLHVTVEDLRDLPPDELGVFSAFMDVAFDSALVSVVESVVNPLGFEIEFGANYVNSRSGDIGTPGLIDEVGALDGFTPLGQGELTLFTVRFAANAAGDATLASKFAEEPFSEVLLFGFPEVVPEDQIDFGSASIRVGPEPPTIVPVDIKPGSDPNSVNLMSKGVLPVAILSTDDFDTHDVDVNTLLFGDPLLLDNGGTAVSPLHSAFEDVSGDGLLDLSLKFSMAEMVEFEALGPDTIEGLLTGVLLDGTAFAGMDSIRIVPPKWSNRNNLQASANPEPSTLTLLWLGMSSLFGSRFVHRRRRSQTTG